MRDASATSGRPAAVHHTATRAALLPSPAPPTLVAAAPPSPSPSHRPPLPAWSPFRCCCCHAADLASLAVASVVSGVPPSPLHSPAARLRCHTPSVAICCSLDASLLRAASPLLSALSLPLVCSCIQFTCQHSLLLRSSLPHWVSHVCCATACALYKCESKCEYCRVLVERDCDWSLDKTRI